MMYMHSEKKLLLLLLLTFRLPTCYYWYVTWWWCHVCAQCVHSTCCYRHSAQDDDVYSLNFDSNVQSGVAFIEPVLDIIVNSAYTLPTCWHYSCWCSFCAAVIDFLHDCVWGCHWKLVVIWTITVPTCCHLCFCIFHCSFTWLPSYLLFFMQMPL